MWMSSRSMSSSGMSAAESVITANPADCSCAPCRWPCMSSAFMPPRSPWRRASAKTRSGSLTWMWIFALRFVPASTSELPSPDNCSRSLRRFMSLPVTTHSVQYRNSRSSSAGAGISMSTSTSILDGASAIMPSEKYSDMPSTSVTNPLAPASTTPAFFSTSSWPSVLASAASAAAVACRIESASVAPGSLSTYSRIPRANAAMTERIVPSRGFDSASWA